MLQVVRLSQEKMTFEYAAPISKKRVKNHQAHVDSSQNSVLDIDLNETRAAEALIPRKNAGINVDREK